MTDYGIASQRQYKRNYECYNAQEYKRKLNATSVTLSARLFCCNTAGLLPKAEPA